MNYFDEKLYRRSLKKLSKEERKEHGKLRAIENNQRQQEEKKKRIDEKNRIIEEQKKIKEEQYRIWYLEHGEEYERKQENYRLENERKKLWEDGREHREILRKNTYPDIMVELKLFLDLDDKSFGSCCCCGGIDAYDSDDICVKDEEKIIIVPLPRVFISYIENGKEEIDLNDDNMMIFREVSEFAEIFAYPSLQYKIIGARIIR
jgi:hypothetical protein